MPAGRKRFIPVAETMGVTPVDPRSNVRSSFIKADTVTDDDAVDVTIGRLVGRTAITPAAIAAELAPETGSCGSDLTISAMSVPAWQTGRCASSTNWS